MKRPLFYLILPLFCVSCNNAVHTVADVLDTFPCTVELNGRDTVIAQLLAPSDIIVSDSLLIVGEPQANPMVSLYDLSGRCLSRFLQKGRGPGETLNLMRVSLYSPSSIQAAVDPEAVYVYDMDELLKGEPLPQREYHFPADVHAFPSIAMCSDGLFLYVGRNQDDDGPNMHRFCIWQEGTGEIETFGTYPADDRIIDRLPADDFSRPTAYQGTAELSPDRSKAVVTYYYAVGFDILDLPGRRISNSVFYQYPQVESVTIPQLKVQAVRRVPESFRGFLDCCCNNEHIYVLYSAKKFSEADSNIGSYILKYDWAGTPLCIYKLDCPASCFTIDSEETVIYAAVQDENGASVVSYDMPVGRI